MKQRLLGSPIGRAALLIRDKVEILKGTMVAVETVGTMVNDQIAAALITRMCGSGKTFIDVGAHIGSIIAQVRHHDPSVRIIAIEAIPDKVRNLRKHFPFVELHDCAVGESVGETSFYVDTLRSGYSSLARPGAAETSKTEIRVRIDMLDNLVRDGDVEAVKIDVEGAELGVLRGAAALIKRCRPIIMFESAPTEGSGLGYTKEDLKAYLDSLDFAVVVPNRVAHEDPGLTTPGFVESHLYPRRTTNYFAIPRERRQEFRDRGRRILRL